MDVWDVSPLPGYAGLMEKINSARKRLTSNPGTPELVAATIFNAASDPSDRLRYLVGSDAKTAWRIRRWLGDRRQMRIFRRLVGL
jgi:hypothetical protein